MTLSVRSRLCAVLTGCTATLALVVASASVDAATITVNTFNQIAPGQCTIATAIASINAAADQVGCTHAGTYGTSDTIVLSAGTYASTAADNGENAYPIILVPVTISGNGATLSRTVGAVPPFFRFFEVGAGGLTLNDATLTGGVSHRHHGWRDTRRRGDAERERVDFFQQQRRRQRGRDLRRIVTLL